MVNLCLLTRMKNHTNPSQTVKILNYLLKGKSITPLEALSRFKCFRLASRINEIKRSGIKISKEIVSRNGKRYAKYSIAKKIKAAAMLLIFVCGAAQAQETINYSGYSYNTGYGNNSPTYNYGTATVTQPDSTAKRTQALVDNIVRDSQARTAEAYRQLDASRAQRQLEYQTQELQKQTKLLQKLANQ